MESVHCSKKELLGILDKISNIRALVVGDLILDRYIWGEVERISPEAPVPIVDISKSEERPGGAANAARNIITLGAAVDLCGFVGDDKEGESLLSLFESEGMGKDGVMVERGRPTSVKTRVMAQRQQMLRIDREKRGPYGAALTEGFAAVVEAQIAQAQVVILSDYGKGCVSESLMRVFQNARKNGKIGLGARPLMLDPHPASDKLYKGICVAKPNRKEAEAATGIRIQDYKSASEAANVLMQRWQAGMMLITLGEDGMLIQSAGQKEPIILPTMAREVFDVSGAGDTVTAVFAASLAAGATPRAAGELANIAAGIVVGEVGTVPIRREQLLSEVEKLP